MTTNKARHIIAQLADADYDGSETITESDAREAIRLAAKPDHSDIDGTADAIKLLGETVAVGVYRTAWDANHAEEYGTDGES